VVQRALDAKGRRLEDWPGYTFEDRQSVEMRAIMGKLLSFQRCRYQVANLDNRQLEHARVRILFDTAQGAIGKHVH